MTTYRVVSSRVDATEKALIDHNEALQVKRPKLLQAQNMMNAAYDRNFNEVVFSSGDYM